MPSRVGERGQITVEKAIREELAVYAGDDAVQWVEDGHLVVAFVPGSHTRSLAGSLANYRGLVMEALVRARDLPASPLPDALVVATVRDAGALPLFIFDGDLVRHGISVREP
jgi:bifunctional DNA-binding transcriptional regulator/antitoxin component of YhaV-PrlF toxin-antitoxin module